jgi:amino acid transporter
MDFPNKVNAAAGFVEFWDTDQRYQPLWLTIFFLVPIGFNFLYVRRLGEIEYWFTIIKITLILILIVTGIIIAMGLPTQPLLGTSAQYKPVSCADNEIGNCMPGFGVINWRQVPFATHFVPGALGGIAGFWKCCTLAVFSYTGCECVGITADEVERQRETLPRAVNRVTSRILYLYMGALLVLGLNLSANDPILASGIANNTLFPGGFIIMVQRANISPALPHIINAIMILAVIAVANADLYIAVRQRFVWTDG